MRMQMYYGEYMLNSKRVPISQRDHIYRNLYSNVVSRCFGPFPQNQSNIYMQSTWATFYIGVYVIYNVTCILIGIKKGIILWKRISTIYLTSTTKCNWWESKWNLGIQSQVCKILTRSYLSYLIKSITFLLTRREF